MNTEDYAHPDVLVSTDWVAEHTNDPSVRVVEADTAFKFDMGKIGSCKSNVVRSLYYGWGETVGLIRSNQWTTTVGKQNRNRR